jgi:hypothetical protein
VTIVEAIKSGKPLRRRNKTFSYVSGSGMGGYRTYITPGTPMAPEYLLEVIKLTKEDILADDWEVEEKKVEITKAQLLAALKEVRVLPPFACGWVSDLCKELGLDDTQPLKGPYRD